jgi:hypothetical protein
LRIARLDILRLCEANQPLVRPDHPGSICGPPMGALSDGSHRPDGWEDEREWTQRACSLFAAHALCKE